MVNTQWLLAIAESTNLWGSAPASSKCLSPRQRMSWADMSATQRSAYITAVQCMMKAPSKAGDLFPESQNRFEDFSVNHIYYTTAPSDDPDPAGHGLDGPGVHFNGVFLPWHRYFLWQFESALINECQYKGAQPYWDWTLDNPEYQSSFEKSTVFDPTTGFGGNGAGSVWADYTNEQAAPPGNCISDGPFATYQANVGYGYNTANANPHCIIRNFNVTMANDSLGWTKNVLALLNHTDYTSMSNEMDTSSVGAPAGIHGAGHKGIGGEMWNIWSTANDPLFYVHHAQLDHIWALWQSRAKANAAAVGSSIYPNGTGTMTADYPLQMAPFIGPSVKTSMVLDISNKDQKGIMCYTYVHEETGVVGYKRSLKSRFDEAML